MRKYLIFGVFAFTLKGYSQKIIFKPLLGINTDVSWGYQNNSIKPGFNVGIQIEKRTSKIISIESGLFFSKINGHMERLFNHQYVDNFYTVEENYKYTNVKIPLNLLLKLNKKETLMLSIGCFVNYSFKANGRGNGRFYTPRSFDTSFFIKTKSGSRLGTGLQTSIRKEIKISSLKFTAGLYWDKDFSKWLYPRNFPYEYGNSFRFQKSNISFLVSVNL